MDDYSKIKILGEFAYIGGNDLEKEGEYRWASDGTLIDHAVLPWQQPSKPSIENCMAIQGEYKNKKENIKCDNIKNFVCEIY